VAEPGPARRHLAVTGRRCQQYRYDHRGNGGTGEFLFLQGAAGDGVDLAAGGTVINGASNDSGALIHGLIGVSASGTAGATVANYGTINGSQTGVYLAGTVPGTISNTYDKRPHRCAIGKGAGRVVNGAEGATEALISADRFGVAAYPLTYNPPPS